MKTCLLLCLLVSSSLSFSANCPAWLDQTLTKLRSQEQVNLCELSQGKTLLLVNTASECGFTKQFKGLEALSQKYKDQGLLIIGFPSNDFFQEHDDSEKTANVCYVNYGVTFLMLESSAVRGSDVNPVFKELNDKLGKPKWNFYKYLVDKNGTPLQRFNSRVKPDSKKLTEAIEQALAITAKTKPAAP
jgi:glutathione peroxidase